MLTQIFGNGFVLILNEMVLDIVLDGVIRIE